MGGEPTALLNAEVNKGQGQALGKVSASAFLYARSHWDLEELELLDQLGKRWTQRWNNAPNPLQELNFGDHRLFLKPVWDCDYKLDNLLDTDRQRL